VCEKTELDLPFDLKAFNWPRLFRMGVTDVLTGLKQAVVGGR
jgi:hypothetical protein